MPTAMQIRLAKVSTSVYECCTNADCVAFNVNHIRGARWRYGKDYTARPQGALPSC